MNQRIGLLQHYDCAVAVYDDHVLYRMIFVAKLAILSFTARVN